MVFVDLGVAVNGIAAAGPRRGNQRASAWRPGTGRMNRLMKFAKRKNLDFMPRAKTPFINNHARLTE